MFILNLNDPRIPYRVYKPETYSFLKHVIFFYQRHINIKLQTQRNDLNIYSHNINLINVLIFSGDNFVPNQTS